MTKTAKTSGLVRSTSAGQFVLKDPAKSGQSARTAAASVLSQSSKTSSGSARVIKDISAEHRDALKRLVDR
jgi:hypothetical protein